MTFASVRRPGLVPLLWFDPRAGLKGLCACAGACAALVHALSLSSISTVFHLTVAMFCVFLPAQAARGASSTTAPRRGAGSSPRARDDDDDDDAAAAAAAAAAARTRTLAHARARTLARPLDRPSLP